MSNIKVSVIMTCYNQENYIKKAVDSVLSQKVDFDYEIIISDDCSRDTTPQILKDYQQKHPDRIRLVLRDKNVGISRNWYEALCMTKGEYVTTLEGDDYWISDEKLQKQADFLDSHSQFAGVTHRRNIVDDNGKVYNYFTADMHPQKDMVTFKNLSKGVIFPYNSCMHRNFFPALGEKEYNFVTHNRSIADFPLTMLVLKHGDVYVLRDVMSVYRVAGDTKKEQSYTSTHGPVSQFEDMVDVLNACHDYGFPQFNFKYAFASWSFMPCLELILAKRVGDIKKILSLVPSYSYIHIPYMWTYYVARLFRCEIDKRRK
ncbi:MAG: glycosyltransferase [Ruminococcaceae bacterium]|nr:glycosyltransferase [Oscillospiraceae bacterium]